jgi:hypothetical protein
MIVYVYIISFLCFAGNVSDIGCMGEVGNVIRRVLGPYKSLTKSVKNFLTEKSKTLNGYFRALKLSVLDRIRLVGIFQKLWISKKDLNAWVILNCCDKAIFPVYIYLHQI